MAKTLDAAQLREALIALLKAHPDGLKTGEIASEVLGNTNDPAEKKNRHQRTWFALKGLAKSKHAKQVSSGFWKLVTERPEPQVNDLPRRGRRPGTTSKNGTQSDRVKRFAIQQIRLALDVLEGEE